MSQTETAQTLERLESAVVAGRALGADERRSLAALPESVLDTALRDLATRHGAAALPTLTALTDDRALRRTARRALYRLAQRGVSRPPAPASRPVITRQRERAVRAWVSGVDGNGSRAIWIVFEGAYGGLSLCSVSVNDTAGIVEVAGGDITKRRLEAELRALRAEQKLPWVETDPARAVALVVEALALHATAGTTPPASFDRWQRTVESMAVPPATVPAAVENPELLERSAELLELPEMAGWVIDPEAVQADAVDLLEARESRLVLSEQLKAEREEAITARVIERELDAPARARWERRLMEMALLWRTLERAEPAAIAEAAAAGFVRADLDLRRHPLALGLVRRGLDVASEVALGRVSASEVSRKPGPVTTGA